MNRTEIWSRLLQIFSLTQKGNKHDDLPFNKFSRLTSSSSSAQPFISQQVPTVPAVGTFVIVILFVILFVSLFINLFVLRSVITLPRRKLKRSATILVAHLSSIAILLALLCVALVSEYIKWVDLTGHAMCKFMNFLKNAIIGIFSLNIVAIIYERFRVLNCLNHGKLLLCRVIILVWIAAIVGNIPTAFMVVYIENAVTISSIENQHKAGTCKPILLFGMFGATVVYEFLRFLLFHVSVACYMVYAMCRIRSKLARLNFLKPIPSNLTRKKVKNIRFIYIHLIIFIVIWLPVGALIFTYRVRKTKSSSSTRNLLIRAITGLLVFIYLVLNPLIYLCLDVGCCFFLRMKNKSVISCLGRETHQMREEEEGNPCNSVTCSDTETAAKVNSYTSDPAGGNEMEMEGMQSGERCRQIKTKSRSELRREAKIAERPQRKSSRERKEMRSSDMSRVSTFMASSTS